MKVSIMSKDGLRVINLNRRKAIHERCLNCSCWNPFDVTNCTFSDCPLYEFRTGKGKQAPKKRKQAIRAYCLWCMAGHVREISKCVSYHCALFPYRMDKTDMSVKIDSISQDDHIGVVFEDKDRKAIPRQGGLELAP